MSFPLVQLRGVTKTYGHGAQVFTALHGIDLEVERGESVALVGKSGSGKSTLMHIMALLDRPSTGQVAINGRDASTLGATAAAAIRNQTFGFVFQQFFMISSHSVLDNVVLPLKIAGVGGRERRRRGMAVLERLDMADKARNRATDLSGGQKQRVVIARALVNSPDLIFADEPTGNLDSATGALVEDQLFGLNLDSRITLVMVTHDRELASRCDRRITLKDGLIDTQAEVLA